MGKQVKESNPQKTNTDSNKKLIFEKTNYILFFVGLAVIILGYLLMVGGGSEDPDVFNPGMFNFRRLTLAPIVLIIGIVIEFIAIFYKKKK
ncbi:MAG: DUF3098 domain-containing protein [Bacteroidales bacterium]|jgi:pilus assembly protein TadC